MSTLPSGFTVPSRRGWMPDICERAWKARGLPSGVSSLVSLLTRATEMPARSSFTSRVWVVTPLPSRSSSRSSLCPILRPSRVTLIQGASRGAAWASELTASSRNRAVRRMRYSRARPYCACTAAGVPVKAATMRNDFFCFGIDMKAFGSPHTDTAIRVMFLGSGELGKEVVIELQRLAVEVIAVDRYAHAPGMQVAHRSHVINMLDGAELRRVIELEKPDLVVPEIEAIHTPTLIELEKQGLRVIPTARAAWLTMDREGIRRLAAEELGLPLLF